MTSKKHIEHHHGRPRTRREFLAHGIIGFSAVATVPDLLSLSARQALAKECPGGSSTSEYMPFMAFDMAGGAALPANFLVGKSGGPEDLLASYDKLGWDPRASGALDARFGLPMSTTYSGMLAGMLSVMSAEAQANFRMGSICHFAQDDTSSNKLNTAPLVNTVGNAGLYITKGLGSENSDSGGRSSPAYEMSSLKPVYVSSFNDVSGAATFGGDFYRSLTQEQLTVLATKALNISAAQAEALRTQPMGEMLNEYTRCAYEKNLTFLSGVDGLDPRLDAQAQALYGINQGSAATDAAVIAASIATNSVKQFTGPGVWTLGGCDYHDGTATTGDGKDREMGVEIGRAVEYAHRSGKPFFFQLLTDGGCSASTGGREWNSDAGDKCMTIMGYYHPEGAPAMRNLQIGAYTDGQGADMSTLVGSQPIKVAYAVFANYLNVCGKLGEFERIVPDVFTPSELDSLLVFEGA